MSGRTGASLDAILREAVERDDVPGVAAVAGNRNGTLYEGAFGRRGLDRPDPMTPDTVVWIASMTKAITTVAALQQVEAGKLALDAPIGETVPALAEPQVLEGFDADGAPRLRPARRPDHAPPPAHPHRGLRLRHLQRRHPPPHGAARPAQHHHLPPRRPRNAAGGRPRRPLGIRHRHRLGGPRRGGRHRPAPGGGRCASACSARSGCRTPPSASATAQRARLAAMHARGAGRLAFRDPLRGAAGPRIPHGRRRPLRHRARLPALLPHGAERRHARRRPHPLAGNGRRDGPQPDRHAHGRAS